MVLRGQPHEPGPDQRPAGEVVRGPADLVDVPAGRLAALGGGHVSEVHRLEDRRGAVAHLDGPGVGVERDRRAQHVVARDHPATARSRAAASSGPERR